MKWNFLTTFTGFERNGKTWNMRKMDKPFITVSGVSKKFEGEWVLRDVNVEWRTDEPTGTLDFETAKLVHKALIDSTKGRMTMIVTSHWPYVIEELTEKVLWLEHGAVVEYWDSKAVVEDFKNQVGEIAHEEYMKVGGPKITKFILEVIVFSEEEVAGILHKTHTELSVGERHRVALAQILMKEPAIAVLDEPTGTMDPITKNFVADTIKSARANLGMTFLIVSHDADFARCLW